MNIIDKNMLIALTITIISELFVLLVSKVKLKRLYLVSIVMNIITNLSFNYILKIIPERFDDIIIYCLEIVIVLIEMFGYFIFTKNIKKSFILSFCSNLFSYLIGLILMPFVY